MASHVVVIDTTFRRANIKVHPGTYLSDILDEACGKLSLKASNYGFKWVPGWQMETYKLINLSRHNNKIIDMSRTFRQSGLSSGAKLELIITSRSPSVVSIALQLPESLAGPSLPGQRLTEKFASNTTLWLILRAFESKGGSNYNFTARGVARTDDGSTGAGRIFYESPVLNIMGRELSSFTDLQKTMAQLGINGGSSLIRLTFKTTEKPLEEAMAEIGEYFKAAGNSASSEADSGSVADLQVTETQFSEPSIPILDTDNGKPNADPPTSMDIDQAADEPPSNDLKPPKHSAAEEKIVGPGHRPMEVFAAPIGSAPKAALQESNDDDYEPTVAHAKLHQQRLLARSQNVRLPSDAEAEAAARDKAAKQAAIKDVSIKVRFPDQLTVVSSFTSLETSVSLYEYVRGVIVAEDEPFLLVYSGPKGPLTVPKSSPARLVSDLGFSGRMLVNFHWDDSASQRARSKQILKPQFAGKAQELKVQEIKANEERQAEDAKTAFSEDKGKNKEGTGKSKGGVPKWLKLPGKK